MFKYRIVILFVLLPLLTGNIAGSFSSASSDSRELSGAMSQLYREIEEASQTYDELRFDKSVLNDFMETVSGLKDEKTVEGLIRQAKRRQSGNRRRFRFYLVESLGFHKSEEVYELFHEILSDDDQLLHVAVANALSISTVEKDIPMLFLLLEGSQYTWEAKLEAVNALSNIADNLKENRENLLRLANLLEQDSIRRRVKWEIVRLLQQATGRDLESPNAVEWKEVIAEKREMETGVKSVPVPKFFELDIKSDRIIFVLDYSMSMDQGKFGKMVPRNLPKLEGDELDAFKKFEQRLNSIQTGKDKKDPLCDEGIIGRREFNSFEQCKKVFDMWIKTSPGNRLDVLKMEIVKAIVLLDCEVYFNVIKFHGGVEIMNRRELIGATWANKAAALQFVLSSTEFGTQNGEGMLCAYRFSESMRGEVSDPKFEYKDREHPFFIVNGADTVVLFTDGKPFNDTIGQRLMGNLIADYFTAIKSSRKVKVDTIGFLFQAESAWLQQLARDNYGECRIYE